MRLLPPIDAPKLKAMGKGTPLSFVPSEGPPPPSRTHPFSTLVGESSGIRMDPPLPQAPWFWFSMQMAYWSRGGCFCFPEGSVTLRAGIAGEAFLSPRDEPGKLWGSRARATQ